MVKNTKKFKNHPGKPAGIQTGIEESGDKLLQTVYNTFDVVEEAKEKLLEVLMADDLMANPRHEQYMKELLAKKCTCKWLNQQQFKQPLQQQQQPEVPMVDLNQPPLQSPSIFQPKYMPVITSQLGQTFYLISAPMMAPQTKENELVEALQSLDTGANQQSNPKQEQAGDRCVFCCKTHHKYQLFCPLLKLLHPHKIWRIAQKNGIACHMCLGINHDVKTCDATKNGLKKCSIKDDQGFVCGQPHCRYLHQVFYQKEPNELEQSEPFNYIED